MADISKLSLSERQEMDAKAAGYENDESIEMAWAIKAYDAAETHMNLLRSVDTAVLRMCECDDEVHEAFRRAFPDLDVALLQESSLKSGDAKEVWRNFALIFEKSVMDYNYGTLLRLDASQDYSQENTILVNPRHLKSQWVGQKYLARIAVTKIQFLGVEIARNKEGINAPFRQLPSQLPPEGQQITAC